MAPGWQVRGPICRLDLAPGDYEIQGPLRAAAQKDIELEDEAAHAIDDTSDDPDVAEQ